MKKLLITALASSSLSASVLAQNNTFTGFYLGAELTSTKHIFSVPYSELGYSSINGNFTASGSSGARFGVVTGYGFYLGSTDFVGQAEASFAFSNAKTKSELGTVTKEQFATSMAYLQGYRLLGNFLPYVKVSLNVSSFDVNNDAVYGNRAVIKNPGAYGVGIGAGMKYAATPDFDIGVEYHKANLKGQNDIRIKTKNITLSGSYHF
ncbi:outer membrane protein [Mannheimia pernigra]|uniref:Porin family protein n=1 Tax=Mannheimia pernigra TaxID=111844 RepID=A0A7D5IUW2_9PAST|nr:outer membrane beta-barrel protein [Mannheimia pernigra]QLB39958.1 porin family protein [Mannheimia pernigra]